MYRSTRKTRLCVESLENRENPAGEITATVSGSVLTITGDDLDNIFSIHLTDKFVEITGTDTIVNGSNETVRMGSVVNSIKVLTYGGSDNVSIHGTEEFLLVGSATFDLGDGSNTLKLVTTGQLSLGSLTVKAGDGLDTVQIDSAAGSQIGATALFQYGIGGSNTTMKHIDMPGVGTVTLAAADGADTFTLDDCETKNVTFSGGYGQSSLIIKNSVVGPVTMNGSQGPASVSLVNSMVNGNVKAAGPEGIAISLDGSTVNGNVSALGGLSDLDSVVGFNVNNAVSVTGGVSAKGFVTNVNMQPASSLTTGLDVTFYATDALTVNAIDTDISARELTLTSPRNVTMIQTGGTSSLTLTGTLTATGRVVDLSFGEVNLDKPVIVTGSAKAWLTVATGALDQYVNVISSLGSAKLILGLGGAVTAGGNVYASGKLTASTGFSGNFLQNITVNGGVKEDSFGLGTGTFSKNVTANLKDGGNVIGIGNFALPTKPNILGNLTITTGNGNDLIGFLCNVNGTTLVNLGGGSDTVLIYRSTFNGATTINTGAGDDSITIQDGPLFDIPVSFNAKATIDTGAGNDKLVMGLAPGDPNQGEGDTNSKAVFAAGFGSSVNGGTGYNTFDVDKGQFEGLTLGVDLTNWTDPN